MKKLTVSPYLYHWLSQPPFPHSLVQLTSGLSHSAQIFLSLTFFHLPPTSMGIMATNGDTSRLPCKAVVTTFLLLLFMYTLTHFSHTLSSSVPPTNLFANCLHILARSTYRPSMLHSITPTSLLHLSPFLSFPSMILSNFYTAYSSWITKKMKASSYCEILTPVYQYASHHISNRKTFISTTIRISKSWKSNVLV